MWLTDGVSELELDEAEQNLGTDLPLDLRCVYRIHNGQGIQQLREMSPVFGYFENVFQSQSLDLMYPI